MLHSVKIALALAYETGRSAGTDGWRDPGQHSSENPYDPIEEADLRLEWYYGYMDVFADLQSSWVRYNGESQIDF
jgi:hypothetical protein